MSVDYFVEPGAAVIWRGPMIHKLLTQFLEDVRWGNLDYLIVDLPPGTGDAQLSLGQLIPLTGGVIVTTPQEVALIDVRKAVNMFQKLEVPVLGVVENMSSYRCPSCGHLRRHLRRRRRRTPRQGVRRGRPRQGPHRSEDRLWRRERSAVVESGSDNADAFIEIAKLAALEAEQAQRHRPPSDRRSFEPWISSRPSAGSGPCRTGRRRSTRCTPGDRGRDRRR